ncbi:unnamed protein product [Agarophyton chilense]
MPPGRRPGVAAIRENVRRREEMAKRGAMISAETAQHMKLQLQTFRRSLEQFALSHKKEIQSDAAFRAKFHAMCASIGVDPLTSRKGIWSDLLNVGDYYYELGVRIIEVCVSTRPTNGGIISFAELVSALRTRRMTYTENVSSDDVERALMKLDVLGGGFKTMMIGHRKIVQSVPVELSVDHTRALALCEETGHTTASALEKILKWDNQRIRNTLRFLLKHEIAWLDLQTAEPSYWILGLMPGSSAFT